MDLTEQMRRLASMTLEERVHNDRETIHQEYASAIEALEPHILKFLNKHELSDTVDGTFAAVDIGAGRAVGTVHLALTFLPLFDGKLQFYPSDYNGAGVNNTNNTNNNSSSPVDLQTRKSLEYHIAENETASTILCHDSKDEPLFSGEMIELGGLTSDAFNGRRGFVKGIDPEASDRLAIQLSPDPKDCKSFRHQNLQYLGAPSAADSFLREMRIQGKTKDIYQGLLDNTREIDVLQRETWSNVEDIYNKCALLTCMSFLSCLGHRAPAAWQDTLELASKLLLVDGYFLQYDESGHAGFGDPAIMKTIAKEMELGLDLDETTICPNNPNYVIAIWRKL